MHKAWGSKILWFSSLFWWYNKPNRLRGPDIRYVSQRSDVGDIRYFMMSQRSTLEMISWCITLRWTDLHNINTSILWWLTWGKGSHSGPKLLVATILADHVINCLPGLLLSATTLPLYKLHGHTAHYWFATGTVARIGPNVYNNTENKLLHDQSLYLRFGSFTFSQYQ